MIDLSGKKALVTGAGMGIGQGIAIELARGGAEVAVHYAHTEPEETVSEIERLGGRATTVQGDLSRVEECERVVDEAAKALGGLDALVNNASILGPSPQPPLLDYPLDRLEEVYRTNAISPLALVQAVRDHLKPGARVVNVTSDAAVEPYEGWGGYGSSKAALEQLSAILAAENPGLHVYQVDPGDMRTRMHQEAFPGEDISDRPLPEESVPGLLALLTGDLPSGRYRAQDLIERRNLLEGSTKRPAEKEVV